MKYNNYNKKINLIGPFIQEIKCLLANFLSTDQKVRYTFTCVKKDLFVDIEKILYEKYPEYKEKNYNFVSQGKIVLRFKTIEENKLVSGVPIVLQN